MKTCRKGTHQYLEDLKQCPECKKTSNKIASHAWYQENKTYQQENGKRYRQEHKEQIPIINKKWYQKNKVSQQEKRKQRYQVDINYKIKCKLRARLSMALKGNFKAGSAVRDLGCSIEEFKVYLESQFESGMTWDNYGDWHIDHKKPLSKFNLVDRIQFLEACHYTNLQPLWSEDNLKKSDSYVL